MNKLNELAKQVHAANIKWWQSIHTGKPIARDRDELKMLCVTELAESLEGARKDLMDDKLPHRRMAEVEMADTVIRLLDYAGGFGIQLEDDRAVTMEVLPDNTGASLLKIAGAIIAIDAPGSVERVLAMIDIHCRRRGYDLDGAFGEKMAYNARRHDHTHEARKAAGGKKF